MYPPATRNLSTQDLLRHVHQLCSVGRFAEAEPVVRRLLSSAPGNATVLNLGSVVAYETGRFEHAVRLAERAIALRPDVALHHANRGRGLTEVGRIDDAISAYTQAIRLDSSLLGVRNGLAFALRCASRLQEAEEQARAAIRQSPRDDSLHANLGCLLCDMGRPEEARACFDEALRLRRLNPEAHHNRGMAMLLNGTLSEGWREYESRWQVPPLVPRGFSQKQWGGEELNGRTLLVHHEQGFGDTIQFCRFVPLAAKSGRIVLEVPRELVRLMSTLEGVSQIVTSGDNLPAFDLHCPMLSLPAAFDTALETIPCDIPYLRSDPDRTEAWRSRLAACPEPRVGLVWAGSRGIPSVDRKRSISFEMLRPLVDVPGVTFVSLQKGASVPGSGNGFRLLDWTEELCDFADTADLVESLDLVISVDTAVAHVAGALGKPVWMLNRFETCWRWLLHREDSPWYPSLRLFRQVRPGDWGDVITRVKAELETVVERRDAG